MAIIFRKIKALVGNPLLKPIALVGNHFSKNKSSSLQSYFETTCFSWQIYSLLMCKCSELKKFNEYFNVLIFGSLDPKNIDLEMAIRKEWKYVINLIIFTGTLHTVTSYILATYLLMYTLKGKKTWFKIK